MKDYAFRDVEPFPHIGIHYALLEHIAAAKTEKEKEYLCRKDVSIYPDFCEEWEIQSPKTPIPRYPSFKTLAILYEKSGRIDEAIEICKEAIRAGAVNDGTKGGMEARLKKLQAKR